jgi:two-component system, NtrC family, sensor kinase
VPPEAQKETLESKARLLLARERELYELRLRRARAEDWLQALQNVWPERFDVANNVLARRALDLLVGSLKFELAAALEYEPQAQTLIWGCRDPEQWPGEPALDDRAAAFLEQTPVGNYDAATCTPLSALAARLGFAKFYWTWCPSFRGSRFLFLAGCGERTAPFHVYTDDDRGHFAAFANHAAALLSNALLVTDVNRERAELETANRGLDRSLSELRETQAQLMTSSRMAALASRRAGMAEVATGILHNVGNVLNSLVVCSDMAREHAEALPISGLERLSQLFADQDDLSTFFRTDPRAPKTLVYLGQITGQFETERQRMLSELNQLQLHLNHVTAIISRQQEYAKTGAVEPCSALQIMEDALTLAEGARQSDAVLVVREFDAVEELEVDRHRVLQILVNLLTNALQALDESDQPSKRLVARIKSTASGMVHFAVEDNGIGISPEVAASLFQHGFTTRQAGHGFGLHTSLLSANQMGGDLRFTSAGRGFGATFVLELPRHCPAPSSNGARRVRAAASRPVQEELP